MLIQDPATSFTQEDPIRELYNQGMKLFDNPRYPITSRGKELDEDKDKDEDDIGKWALNNDVESFFS